MTHQELEGRIKGASPHWKALRSVIELHTPVKSMRFMSASEYTYICPECSRPQVGLISEYPCPTIQAIDKELK